MKQTILKTFSAAVKKIMEEKNISAKDLAQKSAIGYSSLTPILNGSRDCGVTKLVAIANALNCSIDMLLPNLVAYRSGNDAHSTKINGVPHYLVVFIAQTSVTHCLIHEVKTNQQKTIILPYDLGGGQSSDEFTNRIFATLYEVINKNFSISPPSKNIAVFVSAQQYEGINSREKIQKTSCRLFNKFIFEPDFITNYNALFAKQNGICITINNGSTIVYSTDGGKNFIKMQGCGFPITDTAGNEWIGCEAIRYVIRVKEQDEPSTLLSDKILALFNDDLDSIAENVFAHPAATYRSVSTIVKEFINIVPTARSIIEKSARLLLRKIKLIDQKTKNKLPIALAGDLASIYKDFFPSERLVNIPQKHSTILLEYGFTALKKTLHLEM